MKKLIDTMIYVHKSGIIHRDLKPENILVQIEKNQIINLKIIDFGLSCYETELETNIEDLMRCGTKHFAAPEILIFKKDYDKSIDVFSLGMILYFILYKDLPLEDLDSK